MYSNPAAHCKIGARTMKDCRPLGCQGYHGPLKFWHISWPYLNRGDRLCQPNTDGPPDFFYLPTALLWRPRITEVVCMLNLITWYFWTRRTLGGQLSPYATESKNLSLHSTKCATVTNKLFDWTLLILRFLIFWNGRAKILTSLYFRLDAT